MLKLKLGVDVGGTFTDVVAVDQHGHIYYAKTPSTPKDSSMGVIQGIVRILHDLSAAPACVHSVAHGTTVATNTLLERTGAHTALITTKGFRDVIEIGRQSRSELYDLHARKSEALIPRYMRREVCERTLYDGHVLTPLDEDGLRQLVHELVAANVESIAVCFLHAYANDASECRALEIIRSIAPHVPVSLSSDILPERREFERMNTTVMNAYVQPRMEKYLSRLRKRLDSANIHAGLSIMQSSGGMMSDQIAARKSVNTLLSGPAGGVLAAQFLASMTPYKNLITSDVGGTSFDVAVVQNGSANVTGEGCIEGFSVKFPHLDITTIGAGGGSIAWLDAGGALRVGPRSAGAVPGPVCYCKGGEEPTVTDAHAVLGRLSGELLGGEMRLDIERARSAIAEKLSTPTGISVEEMAEGILRVVNANMVRAIRVMTVERGIDPRKFAVLPFGGAGALHGVDLARAMDIRQVIVPPAPGNFSAFGLLAAPVRYDESCAYLACGEHIQPDKISELLAMLQMRARDEMRRDGIDEKLAQFEPSADMRYLGQAFELSIPLHAGLPVAAMWEKAVDDFHAAHERAYGFKKTDDPIEVVNLRLCAVSDENNAPLCHAYPQQNSTPVPVHISPAYFYGRWIDTPTYRRNDLAPGAALAGPAIIAENGATTVVGPGDQVQIDEYLNLVIRVVDQSQSLAAAAYRQTEEG